MKLSELPEFVEDMRNEILELRDDVRWCRERIRDMHQERKRSPEVRKRPRETIEEQKFVTSSNKVHIKLFPSKYNSQWLRDLMEDRFGAVKAVRIGPLYEDSNLTWASVAFEQPISAESCLERFLNLKEEFGFEVREHKEKIR